MLTLLSVALKTLQLILAPVDNQVLNTMKPPALVRLDPIDSHSGTSDKGPSEKRTASLERTFHYVSILSFTTAVIHF